MTQTFTKLFGIITLKEWTVGPKHQIANRFFWLFLIAGFSNFNFFGVLGEFPTDNVFVGFLLLGAPAILFAVAGIAFLNLKIAALIGIFLLFPNLIWDAQNIKEILSLILNFGSMIHFLFAIFLLPSIFITPVAFLMSFSILLAKDLSYSMNLEFCFNKHLIAGLIPPLLTLVFLYKILSQGFPGTLFYE